MDSGENYKDILVVLGKWIWKNVPLIMVVVAIVLLLLTEFDIVVAPWDHYLELLATTILGGGFFTMLTKTTLIRGLYQEDIRSAFLGTEFQGLLQQASMQANEAAMLTDDYLARVGDPVKVWEIVTRWMTRQRFPEQSEEIMLNLRAIMPHKVFNLQENVRRDVRISWFDKARGLVLISIAIDGHVTHNPASELPHERRACLILDRIEGINEIFRPGRSSIGGQECQWRVDETRSTTNSTAWILGWTPVFHRVEFHDAFAFIQDIEKDNVYSWRTQGYLRGMTVEILCEDGIEVSFIRNSGAKWTDLESPSPGPGTSLPARQFKKTTADLLFADEGFSLLIQRTCAADCPVRPNAGSTAGALV